ncbi:N-acetyl-gamma-glutamyl-phosphate reductase [Micromonospora yangpuensis]|uniref:N-acetyl-gamma-glutamyl-phosphate reductase n=1 Tax=Micromonospora yangpuensis TaxID=683228 RepID=A0A1C6VI55_9ACTN|nr:N-acetyl-gamma-glutamyl-phosphate reductase [Micromonospora yangpuensis]GGL99336.1 N-acetyl-gamma-glutamyl-phosphate reductase [Micromonospora yangpuensis]SCL65570.1 N-acetyl-gamma-glutamyl-phosphate reductase [Micromonospora yangpuensis]
MVDVAVVGGAGYIGGELLRMLIPHPDVTVVAATSDRLAGRRVDGNHPTLRGHTDLTYAPHDRLPDCDVLLLAAPGAAMSDAVRARVNAGAVLIDIGPELRLADPATYRRYYGGEHPSPELAAVAVPGLPELHRAALTKADTIAVPGCMATAAILALQPLAAAGLIGPDVLVDGRIGSSGSGSQAGEVNQHAERAGVLRVFAPSGHRHEAEIAQATGLSVRMGATGVDAVRGAQVLCRVTPADGLTELDIRTAYRARYADEPFVRVIAQRRGNYRLPEPKILLGTNYCDVGFSFDAAHGELVLIAALDNLGKGGAGNAVQCLNVRMGLPERRGLEFLGLHPI